MEFEWNTSKPVINGDYLINIQLDDEFEAEIHQGNTFVSAWDGAFYPHKFNQPGDNLLHNLVSLERCRWCHIPEKVEWTSVNHRPNMGTYLVRLDLGCTKIMSVAFWDGWEFYLHQWGNNQSISTLLELYDDDDLAINGQGRFFLSTLLNDNLGRKTNRSEYLLIEE